MVLVLAKYGKINNAQVAVLAVTAVLKKAIPTIRKSCDSYHEKSCDSYHEKKLSQLSGKLFALGRSQ